MAGNRSLNRFNRFIAKRRRRSIRLAVTNFREGIDQGGKFIEQKQSLRMQAWQKDILSDFFEIG